MPEKVHMMFGDDKPTQSKPSTSQLTSSSKPTKSANSDKASTNPNGPKRNRDGSPKDAPHKTCRDSNPAKIPSNGHNQANGTFHQDDDPNERPRKSKKPNGVASREVPSLQELTANRDAYRARGGIDKFKLARLRKARTELPIWQSRSDIRYALRKHNILLILGETGSGKSTQTPQFLYEEPWCVQKKIKVTNKNGTKQEAVVGGMIAITQPRRVAAITLAQRVAAEMDQPFKIKGRDVEGTVGYAVRFDSYVPRGTKIKFVTEGILLQEMLHDPDLKKYSCIIVDEIHERSVDVDLIAGFLRKLVHGDFKGRGGIPLKVVVMSATFDLGGYEAFFAKPETLPEYKPGQNYGKILDPELKHLLKPDPNLGSPDRLSVEDEYSSWDGLSDDAKSPESPTNKITEVRSTTPKKTGTPQPAAQSNNSKSPKPKKGEPAVLETPQKSTTAHSKAPKEPREETEEEILALIAPNGVAIEKVEGRKYDVETTMLVDPSTDMLDDILHLVLNTHLKEPMPGDILVFLTGQDEIETLKTQLQHHSGMIKAPYPKLQAMGLYGSMHPNAQTEVFKPLPDKKVRKVVLATNIAETSVTVPGVRFVVDCGKAKVKQYRPKLGMESLLSKPISKVSSIQRMGRAGREAKGKCFRMYTNDQFLKMDMDELPEILRCDVIEAVLKMLARGVDDVFSFPLMDTPDFESMKKAMVQLYEMGAIGKDGRLNDVGKQMASFPLPAAYGRVLIAASESDNDVVLETIDVIACLTTDSEIFMRPKSTDEEGEVEGNRNDITRREGDIVTLLSTMQKYASTAQSDRGEWCRKRLINERAMKMATSIRKQLRDHCFEIKLLSALPEADPLPFEPISPERAEVLVKTFLSAFTIKTAVLGSDGQYKTTLGNHPISIHPSSVLFNRKVEAIMFLENVFTVKNYAKKVSAIQSNWIQK